MGQQFDSMQEELTKLTLWNTILDCIEKILGHLLERCGINLDDVIADILRNSEAAKEILYMAKAMTEYRSRVFNMMYPHYVSFLLTPSSF